MRVSQLFIVGQKNRQIAQDVPAFKAVALLGKLHETNRSCICVLHSAITHVHGNLGKIAIETLRN
jgi:hypothetical protein